MPWQSSKQNLIFLANFSFKDFTMKSVPNHPKGSLHRRDLSWGWTLHSTGIRRKVLTTKYSIVYMEKEAWPEKKDFLQEQEKAMKGPYSHP